MVDCITAEKNEEEARGVEEVDRSEITNALLKYPEYVPLHRRHPAVELFIADGKYDFPTAHTDEGEFVIVSKKVMLMYDSFRDNSDNKNIVLVDEALLYYLSQTYKTTLPEINVLTTKVWRLTNAIIVDYYRWKDDIKKDIP